METQEKADLKTQKILRPSVTLFEWTAPERLFKKRSREFYRKIAVIIMFFALFLVAISDFTLVIVLGVVFFATYIFTSIPPRDVTHKITTNGISYASGIMYYWEDLINFYIEEREDIKILQVNTKTAFPGRIFMILSKEIDVDKLTRTLNEYLSINENPEKNYYQDIMNKVSSKLKIQ